LGEDQHQLVLITSSKEANRFSLLLMLRENGGVGGFFCCKGGVLLIQMDVSHAKGSIHASREATESIRLVGFVEYNLSISLLRNEALSKSTTFFPSLYSEAQGGTCSVSREAMLVNCEAVTSGEVDDALCCE